MERWRECCSGVGGGMEVVEEEEKEGDVGVDGGRRWREE